MAFGAEYEWNQQWTFRAGYQYDQTPTNDQFRTTRTPDGDRNWFTLGTTYKMNDRLSFDVSGAYIDINDEQINVTRRQALTSANIQADTEGYVGILSAGLNYKF